MMVTMMTMTRKQDVVQEEDDVDVKDVNQKILKFPIGSTVTLKDDKDETLTVTKYNAETKEYTCKYDDDDVEDVFEENELMLERPD